MNQHPMRAAGINMEGTQAPPSGGAKESSKGKSMWMIATIIVAILLIASVTVLGVLPALYPSAPSVAKFNLVALDFAYNKVGTNPKFQAKVNQAIWFAFSNIGTHTHEFLLYQNKDAALINAKYALVQAQKANPGWQVANSTASLAAQDQYNTLHDSWTNLTRYNNVDRNVEPDNTTNLLFVVDKVGTYFFVCHQLDTTDAAKWVIHQDHGMWGELDILA